MNWPWVVHNVVAHPLLVLCPPLGRRLHAATWPTRIELDDATAVELDTTLKDALRGVTLHVRKAPWGDDYWSHTIDANSLYKIVGIAMSVVDLVLFEAPR